MIYSEADIPDEVRDALYQAIRDVDDDCIDNYRFARADDVGSLFHYLDLKESGCCGSHDASITVEGVQWHFGFNYGH